MINYVTKRPYSGVNAATLSTIGVDSVVTFKQAIRDLGLSGQKMKGLKACARLVIFKEDEETGEKKPRFFSVFDANEVLARKGVV